MDDIISEARRRKISTGVIALPVLLFLFSFVGSLPVLHWFGLEAVNADVLFVSRLLYWLAVVLVWLYANKAEQQNLLIRKEEPYPLSTYIASFVIILLILFAGSVIISLLLTLAKLMHASSRMEELVHIFNQHPFLMVFTSLTAGVTEELLFRGYLQTRFEQLFRNPYIAMILSSLLFGFMHYGYGTLANVLVPFFIGFVFAFYYYTYRNIKVLIICHFVWDLVAISLTMLKYRA